MLLVLIVLSFQENAVTFFQSLEHIVFESSSPAIAGTFVCRWPTWGGTYWHSVPKNK